MRITPDEVRRIAALARLEMTDDEVARMAGELDGILGHFEKLGALALDEVPETAQSVALEMPLRDDEPERSLPLADTLRGAPESKDGLFVVPKVL